ncbi:predicted protein [Sclerotinia sclerotiorum 1980 UF-70]|uniref:Uncharacterized protein n=1 Tax=Sclerotinia sclerotiorum (strain ATCC 18683 / 1980 / Ss-1) TaxID=665079 RepID=A7F0J4_SCLS1|nr:predicted protein [Sclerotinia sclerotiorum 1980 UF-70]EDN95236.1 predicted protein [Sclerotinia sclerotiorum 1980 UF-70]
MMKDRSGKGSNTLGLSTSNSTPDVDPLSNMTSQKSNYTNEMVTPPRKIVQQGWSIDPRPSIFNLTINNRKPALGYTKVYANGKRPGIIWKIFHTYKDLREKVGMCGN